MANKHGDFIWYELMTADPGAAAKFYSDVVGWSVADSGQAGMDYRILQAPAEAGADEGAPIGGMLSLSAETRAGGAAPGWFGYVAVDDTDAAAQRIAAAGGSVVRSPWDIPDVGRAAMVADGQGTPFYVMRLAGDFASLAFAHDRPRPGHCAWNELSTNDPKDALRFYGDVFGWTKDGEMDLGPMGSYEFLRHGALIGALSPCMAEGRGPVWTYYFRTSDIDAAAERVKAGGGQVVNGPMEIPGGDFIVHGLDPEGAALALVGARP